MGVFPVWNFLSFKFYALAHVSAHSLVYINIWEKTRKKENVTAKTIAGQTNGFHKLWFETPEFIRL